LMLTLFINVSFSLTRNSWQGIGFGRLCVTYNACYDVAVFVTITAIWETVTADVIM